jgi:2-methylcitrate dehydratase PrpD
LSFAPPCRQSILTAARASRQRTVLALARKITYRVDPSAPGRDQYKWWIVVHLKGDRTLERVQPNNWGSPQNPMTEEDVRGKFRENAARMLKPGQVEAVIERVNAIEQTRTLQPLLELCVARER